MRRLSLCFIAATFLLTGCWLDHGRRGPHASPPSEADPPDPPDPASPPDDDGFDQPPPGVDTGNPLWLRMARTTEVNAVVETEEGINVATPTGLVRRSGEGVLTFLTPENSPLPSLEVTALAVGPEGTLWVGTAAGLVERAQGQWIDHGLAEGFIGTYRAPQDLAVDSQGRVLASSQSGLARLEDGEWTLLDRASLGIPAGYVSDLAPGAEGAVWISLNPELEDLFTDEPHEIGGGLVRMVGDEVTVFDVTSGALPTNHVAELADDGAGGVYAILGGPPWTLVVVEEDGVRDVALPEGLETLTSIAVRGPRLAVTDSEGALWILEKGWTRIAAPPDATRVRVHLADAAGHYWIAGPDLYEYEWTGQTFTARPTSSSELPTNELVDLAITADDRVWLATPDRGLLVFDGATFESQEEDLASDAIEAVEVDPDDHVWVLTADRRVFEQQGDDWISWDMPPAGPPAMSFELTLNVDCPGEVWIGAIGGSYGGLYHFVEGAWTFYDYTTLPNHSVRTIDCDEDGTWVGTLAGNVTHYAEGRFTDTSDAEPGAPLDFIQAVRSDPVRDGVWVGYLMMGGGGLTYHDDEGWHPADLSFLGTQVGATAIAEDLDQAMLFIAEGTLIRVDPATMALEPIAPQSSQYGVAALETDSRGNVFLASNRGLVVYNPRGVQGLDAILAGRAVP